MLQPISMRYDDGAWPAHEYSFVDARGGAIAARRISVQCCVKAEPGEPRQSYRIIVGGQPALMKVRQISGIRGRLKASLGDEYLRREQRFLEAAARLSLPVTHCLGHGWRREFGLVAEQALLIEWLDEFHVLRDAVRDALERGDRERVRHSLLPILTDLLSAIRRTGLADKDFGAHNILIRERSGGSIEYRWIDLERCSYASDDDAAANAYMVGSALASWWVATAGSVEELLFAWNEIRKQPAKPANLGKAAAALVDHEMREKIAELVSRQWIDRIPPAGILNLDGRL